MIKTTAQTNVWKWFVKKDIAMWVPVMLKMYCRAMRFLQVFICHFEHYWCWKYTVARIDVYRYSHLVLSTTSVETSMQRVVLFSEGGWPRRALSLLRLIWRTVYVYSCLGEKCSSMVPNFLWSIPYPSRKYFGMDYSYYTINNDYDPVTF